MYKGEQGLDGVCRSKRSEIFASVGFLTGVKQAGKFFVGNAHPWVGLVVLEKDVVFGLELFYQYIFEEQSFAFAVDNGVFDVAYLADEDLCLAVEIVGQEIGTDSVFQAFGFANIDDGSVLVEIPVNARGFRQGFYNFGYMFRSVHCSLFCSGLRIVV